MLKDMLKYKILKRILYVSGITNALLFMVLMSLVIFRQFHNDNIRSNVNQVLDHNLKNEYSYYGNDGRICLPCDLQRKDVQCSLYSSLLITENNSTLCCLEQDSDLQHLILDLEQRNSLNTFHETNKALPENLQWWKQRNHAAHMYALTHAKEPTWSEHTHSTAFVRNLTNSGTSLIVSKRDGQGTYFVYSLYTFDFNALHKDKPMPIGLHRIYRKNTVMTNAEKEQMWLTKFGGMNSPKRQTTFICGIVTLNLFDSIETEAVSFSPRENKTTKYIDKSPYSNYFEPTWSEHTHSTAFVRNLTNNGTSLIVSKRDGQGTYFVYSLYTFDFSALHKDKQCLLACTESTGKTL